ncbi:hypothetical protein VNI00_010363 [Paramarasmius palmivorus]|uniref:Uncharacterized protein n=1 Tax=Paramarasmius palmivorus TaxID=297713 RepID=A0AAW0CJJ5_9AGAR
MSSYPSSSALTLEQLSPTTSSSTTPTTPTLMNIPNNLSTSLPPSGAAVPLLPPDARHGKVWANSGSFAFPAGIVSVFYIHKGMGMVTAQSTRHSSCFGVSCSRSTGASRNVVMSYPHAIWALPPPGTNTTNTKKIAAPWYTHHLKSLSTILILALCATLLIALLIALFILEAFVSRLYIGPILTLLLFILHTTLRPTRSPTRSAVEKPKL